MRGRKRQRFYGRLPQEKDGDHVECTCKCRTKPDGEKDSNPLSPHEVDGGGDVQVQQGLGLLGWANLYRRNESPHAAQTQREKPVVAGSPGVSHHALPSPIGLLYLTAFEPLLVPRASFGNGTIIRVIR